MCAAEVGVRSLRSGTSRSRSHAPSRRPRRPRHRILLASPPSACCINLPNLINYVRWENGITQRLTKPRSPATTGKIERWHKTLRRELLDHVAAHRALATAGRTIWAQCGRLPRAR